jgi:hypothetical protein
MKSGKSLMICLVTGGRDYADMGAVFDCLTHLDSKFSHLLVVHGDARGADNLAYEVCKEAGIDQVRVPASWNKYKRRAGPVRNRFMTELFDIDMVLAFPGGTGTADMMEVAESKGIPVVESQDLLGMIRGGGSQK